MEKLEEKIGYRFKDRSLLLTAMTHTSYANENRADGISSYERLEFLGDSILGYVTAEFLYNYVPAIPEGRMTRLRAELVCEASLHKVAQSLGFGEYLRLGRGEECTGGRERVSVLADTVEAVIAAMYIDGGLEPARSFILNVVLKDAQIGQEHRFADYKTELQELIQQHNERTISYEQVKEEGPDHCKLFTFRVMINGEKAGEGSGHTKKEAEQMAACRALESLKR